MGLVTMGWPGPVGLAAACAGLPGGTGRRGRVLDRREFFWEDLPEFPNDSVGTDALLRPAGHYSAESVTTNFSPGEFFSALLTQLYIGQPYVPRNIYVPVDFQDRETLEEVLSEQIAGEGARATRVRIVVPQRGDKRSLLDLAGNNAKMLWIDMGVISTTRNVKIQFEA